MKFTDGYWQIRKNIEPLYAAEFYDRNVTENELTVFAPGMPLGSRADSLNLGMLTVKFSSPLEDVIKVSICHFEGSIERGPFVEVEDSKPEVELVENEDAIVFKSGKTSAVIDKRAMSWNIRFLNEDSEITNSGFKNMARMYDSNAKKSYMVEQLAIDIDECIYGLGERFTPFVKNGQTVEMWNEDGGTASEITYKNIPFYISNKGYGVFLRNEGDVAYEIASEKVERLQFSVEGERLEYYVINGGSPKNTIRKYTQLTGKPALPPAWSFGLWLTTSFTTNYDEETTLDFIKGMEQYHIPLSVFHFDCFWMKGFEWCDFEWDSKTFPEPEEMLKRYHDRGLKICVWINPYIGQKSKLFAEGLQKGYFIKKQNGDIWQTNMWQAGMGIVDFTNPEATAWYVAKLKMLLDMGVDCFKTDFGERIPVKDIVYYDGSDAVKMHNHYPYLYNKAVFELLEKERGEGDAALFARSATTGSQKFPIHWGGDCAASYPSMAETLRGGLSLSLAGFGFWSHDISGFESTATADIYKRWCQFGLLCSHSRLHGSTSYRVPWLFDEEACQVLQKFVNLKCQLMPYLYAQAVLSRDEGVPMMRPMFVEFSGERSCEYLDKQYMLGDNLLVAPIFKESGEVEYYLPKGKWVNILNDQVLDGGEWKKENHDYFSIPLLMKPNSILVMGDNKEAVEYDYLQSFTLLIAVFENGKEAKTTIVDINGKNVATIIVKKEADVIQIQLQGIGNKHPWNYKLLGEQKAEIVIEYLC